MRARTEPHWSDLYLSRSPEETAMYNPIFEMISDSIVAERIAEAERQRTANALARGSSRGQSARAGRLHVVLRALTRRPDTSALWVPSSESVGRGRVGTG